MASELRRAMRHVRLARSVVGRDICSSTGLYTPIHAIRTFITSPPLARVIRKGKGSSQWLKRDEFRNPPDGGNRSQPWHFKDKEPDPTDNEGAWQRRLEKVRTQLCEDVMPEYTDEKWAAAVKQHTKILFTKDAYSEAAGGFSSKLKDAYRENAVTGLYSSMKAHVVKAEYLLNCTEYMKEAQAKLSDLRYPTEWYPSSRMIKRTWHLHVGPTNSGKTYNALKRLEELQGEGQGIYAGPLRLLAHEIYDRLNAKGIRCDLITGEERRKHADGAQATIVSCTVEMADTSKEVDVAVVDEIQMIADPDRGWAWTQAVLGLKARELHLCGELRAVGIIEKLAKLTGDKLVIHRYERLGPLEVQHKSIELKDLEKGDAVVVFSRKKIYTTAAMVEKQTGLKCAVVYGGLPAETRASQAQRFNDPNSDVDVLVASDAIGMGLNLSIRRVIFSTMYKWDGKEEIPIPIPSVLQIAGRAGRYRSAHEDKKSAEAEGAAKRAVTRAAIDNTEEDVIAETVTVAADAPPAESTDNVALPAVGALPPAPRTGFVTTLMKRDLPLLATSMATTVKPIKHAVLQPMPDAVEAFAQHFPKGTPFYMTLKLLKETAKTSDLFCMGSFDDVIDCAECIENIPGLTYAERFKIAVSPARLREPEAVKALRAFARVVGKGDCVTVLDIADVDLEALDAPVPKNQDDLRRLEVLHSVLLLYMWLGHRFPGNFSGLDTTMEIKAMCELKIDQGLRALRSEANKAERTSQIGGNKVTGTVVHSNEESQATPVAYVDDDSQGSNVVRLVGTKAAKTLVRSAHRKEQIGSGVEKIGNEISEPMRASAH